MNLANHKTIDNPSKQRFELEGDDGIAVIDYKIGKTGKWYLVHTEVPENWEGLGAGYKIVREALNILDQRGEKIIPICPFIKVFIKKHKDDYEHLLADGVKL
ncbi:GNAT family N-acetyltransferase [Ekhidna sp.]